MTAEAAETRTKVMTPGQAVEEEHLVVGAIGLMTTEEVGTTVKTSMRDGMMSYGSTRMLALDGYGCADRGPPPRTKLNQKPQSSPKEEDSSPSTSQCS